jgi:lysophospholipase L1-like esterase
MKLKGKIINFLGDSITEGFGTENTKKFRYDNFLKKLCKLKATFNYGISGSRLAHQSVPTVEEPRKDLCFCGRAYDMEKSADIVVVYGGINDYLSGDAPIGEWGDKTPATYYGAVWFLMNLIREKHPKATVVFMTPARCHIRDITSLKPSPNPIKKSDAMPVAFYGEVIKQTAREFAIPVLDLYNTLPIDPNKDEDKEKYTSDGLHFNDEGHRVLARCLKDFLENL